MGSMSHCEIHESYIPQNCCIYCNCLLLWITEYFMILVISQCDYSGVLFAVYLM